MVYLPLLSKKVIWRRLPWKLLPWRTLTKRVVGIIFIAATQICITIVTVRFVMNNKIMTTSPKSWAILWRIKYGLCFLCVDKFVHISKRKQEGSAITRNIVAKAWLPFLLSVSAYDLTSLLSFNNSEGLCYPITFLVKLRHLKVVLTGFK